jgi:antitoxin (DNA-binding transcriptional repressor) of toxin-antitoxin stability system
MGDSPSYNMRSGADAIMEMVAWMRSGANVVIEVDGQPVACLVPYVTPPADQAEGSITMNVGTVED